LCVYRAGYFANPQGARVQIPSSSHAIDNPFLATSPFCSYNRFASTPLWIRILFASCTFGWSIFLQPHLFYSDTFI